MRKKLLAFGTACMAISGLAASSQMVPDVNVVSPMRKIAPGLGSMTDIITSVEGEKKDVTVTTSGLTISFAGLEAYSDQMIASNVVYGDDNEVYIYNIFTYLPTNSYIKGIMDGDKLVISLPQAVYYDDSTGMIEAYYYTLVDIVEGVDEDGYPTTSYIPREKSTLTFSIDEFGTMVAEDLGANLLLGAVDSEDGSWIGLGASYLSISSFDEEPVEVPAGIEVSKNYWTSVGNDYGWQVNFAQDGDDIYFQGLSERMPEAWVKGTVERDGNTAVISIPQDQYVGDFRGYHIFIKCVEMATDKDGNIFYDDLMPSDYVYQLVWDLEKQTISAKDSSMVLLFNTSMKDAYFVNDLIDMKLHHQESFAGVPSNPYGLAFEDFMDDEGFSMFSFYLPGISTEGDCLLIEDLSYVIYIDDEVWTLEAEDYDLEESLDEIPWNYNGYWIIKNYDSPLHRVPLFVEGITTLGVQTIYRYNDVETRSDIVSINLEEQDAVAGIEAGKVTEVKYYDPAGREVRDPGAGIFIVRVVCEDGTVTSFKKVVH
ncbi:MAG: hypothetical protein K2O47_02165 [Muribaculaceae bacterium]|nr:hypothetical protein [Muribaculaceae bacterium]